VTAKKSLLFAALLAASLPMFATPVDAAKKLPADTKIKKCQDESGKWHYGDEAAEECARERIIELSPEGIKTGVIKAPPTPEEIKKQEQQQAELEEARKQAEDQARRDQQLLATYGHEKDIIYIRDRKLAQIEYTISAASETMKPLRAALSRMQAEANKIRERGREVPPDLNSQITQTQAQIIRHEVMIAKKRQEQKAITQQAESDLNRYRELKMEQQLSPTASKDKKQ
jgi:chromosome segregation ATPase